MSSINGIFAYHSAAGEPRLDELLATRDRMRARGPDGEGVAWSRQRRCALGHRRLSILDLSPRAAQPMASEDGRITIVFNGEIYNYPNLRTELEADGARFSTTSETEALLHLYAREGYAMLHRLRGMFAFAIWDEARRALFLARDPYGIKPLYTANDGWCFRFASQVKALLAGGSVSRDPEPAGLVGFHLFGSVPEPFTLYRDIRALPAGHFQWVDEDGAREPQQYASIAAVLDEGRKGQFAVSPVEEVIAEGVRDSVQAHLLADVEVGVFLSAGVDSGALLGVMRDCTQSKIRAITLAFEEFRGTAEDEAPLAGEVSRAYDAEHIVRVVNAKEFRDDWPAILEAMDQPSIDGVNTWFVAKAANEAGLKVALSGLGGDELLGGYSSFKTVPRWRRIYGPLAGVPGLGALARTLIASVAPGLARSRPKALGVLTHAGSFPGAYLLQRALYLPHELDALLDRDVVREGLRRLEPMRRLAAALEPDPKTAIARVCALESSYYLRNQLLRDADWAGMAHSVEIRVPLVDTPLLRRVSRVFGRLRPGVGTSALAHAPRQPLPPEIVARKKTGFSVPAGAWLAGSAAPTPSPNATESKGIVLRRWSREVLAAQTAPA